MMKQEVNEGEREKKSTSGNCDSKKLLQGVKMLSSSPSTKTSEDTRERSPVVKKSNSKPVNGLSPW